MKAAREGRTNLVEELLEKEADVDAKDEVRYLRGYYRVWSRREKVCWR